MKKYLEAGKIINTHGIKGEVRIDSWFDTPEDFLKIDSVWLKQRDGFSKVKIERSRIHKGIVLAKLEGVDSINQAEALKETVVYIDRSDYEISEDSFFVQDLIGIRVFDVDTGVEYGEIIDVLKTGANDVYVIKGADREYLVPAIKDCIISVDTENKVMKIKPLKGLFD